jgi:NAD-dependent SIR2 family protein deacetylase
MSLATPEAFFENPSRVWQFYHYRREKYSASRLRFTELYKYPQGFAGDP